MNWLDMLLNEGERAARLRSELPYFAEQCLKLRPKTGSLAPFLFNPAQLELNRRIEEQKAETGRVRVIILKARQLGISTYVSARFFHRCLFEPGLRTFMTGSQWMRATVPDVPLIARIGAMYTICSRCLTHVADTTRL